MGAPHDHRHDDPHAHDQAHDGPDDHAPGHDHAHPRGWRGVASGLFRPHSHDHTDTVADSVSTSAAGVRALKLSLVILATTAALQLVVVVVSGSTALLADTVHNFSDALTAVPLWVAFVVGRRAASRRYTYGYGRAEDLAGLFVVAMIALSAGVAGYESIRRLLDPQPVDNVGIVLAAGVIGFLGNEAAALIRIRTGRRIGSAALVADGLHARADGFTSLAVVGAALGVMAGFPLADPIIGLLITVAILFVLRGAARDVGRRLMDAVDPAVVATAESALRGVPGVRDVERVQLRWTGHVLRAEAGVVVDPELTVVEAHEIATEAHHRLLHVVPRLVAATVHTSPDGADGHAHHARLAHHSREG
ncbi:MAG: cation diffusion facilitator family transporter [Actinomycetales bacterium]